MRSSDTGQRARDDGLELRTCLVGDLQRELLQVAAVDIARLAGERQVGGDAAVCLLHIGSLVAGTGVEAARASVGQGRRRREAGVHETAPEPHGV